jgi:hypothetical protein
MSSNPRFSFPLVVIDIPQLEVALICPLEML